MALTPSTIAQLRLRNQWIDTAPRHDPAGVVGHLVAVQSQDYAGAKWSLGLRLRGAHERDVEQAFNSGTILRTHVLRPTWHFVTPQDIRWLLALTGPRVQASNGSMYRKAGMDARLFRRCESVLQKALAGGTQLTRVKLREAFRASGLSMDHEFRFTYALMHAELEGLICSGPRRGKQFTYSLLDERAPSASALRTGDALIELSRRYFLSRGPATVHDFAKWSGLTLADCRAGLEAVRPLLQKDLLEGQEYWFADHGRMRQRASPTAHLLSVYDELLSSYKGHSAIVPAEISRRLRAFGNALTGVMLIDGIIIGTWKRALGKKSALIKLEPFSRLTSSQRRAIASAAARYGEFHQVKARVS